MQSSLGDDFLVNGDDVGAAVGIPGAVPPRLGSVAAASGAVEAVASQQDHRLSVPGQREHGPVTAVCVREDEV